MAEPTDTKAILAFLQDESLRALLRESMREHLPWEKLIRMSLPHQMSAVDTWEVLGSLLRVNAIFNPVHDPGGESFWYTPTQRINTLVSQLEYMCRSSSPLHLAVQDTASRQFIVQSRIEESIAAAKLDGVFPLKDTLDRLSLDRTPRNANEQLIANADAVAAVIHTYRDEPFSRDLLLHLRNLVLEGVDVEALQLANRRKGVAQEEYPEELLRKCADQQMVSICDYANGDGADPFDSHIVRAIVVRDALRGYNPLPLTSGAIARLAFALYAIKVDLPLLALLPLATAALEWEDHTRTVAPFDDRVNLYHPYSEYGGMDITPFLTITLQLALQTLNDLESKMTSEARKDREVRDILQEDETLNHRQRSILWRALRIPDAEFGIRYHRTKHNIAYATARADLMKLADMGYLALEERGQTFIFKRGPRLDELTSRM